jgi:hypothetical protein
LTVRTPTVNPGYGRIYVQDDDDDDDDDGDDDDDDDENCNKPVPVL